MKNLKKLGVILLLTLSLATYSCTSENVKTTKTLSETYEYDGQAIEIEGKFGAPMMVRTGGKTTSLNFITYNDYIIVHSGHIIIPSVILNYGEDKNSVIIDAAEGEKFTKQDVVIYDKDGNKVSLDDKVKLKGLVKYLNKDKATKSYVYEIIDIEIEKK